MEGRKKMLYDAGSGAMGRKGKSYFFSDWNTAVRCAEVHSLPPFDVAQGTASVAGYGLQAHGNFGTELSICCFGLVNEYSK